MQCIAKDMRCGTTFLPFENTWSYGVKKKPGYSCVDLGKENEVFYAGETMLPVKDVIFSLLKELDSEMRKRGYEPDTSVVLHAMEEQEKEKQLFWHSERVAVAYGLLKSVPGTSIRILKYLRICGDCHVVLKFICSIVGREIVIRDASRFHHFKNGVCSCKDFWRSWLLESVYWTSNRLVDRI